MKKLLIIQLDEAYFLFETIRVLEKYHLSLKQFELTLLVSKDAFDKVYNSSSPILKNITFDKDQILKDNFDISANLSLREESWDLHSLIKSETKVGPYLSNGQLMIPDLWSSFLITVKAKSPFLTFHLQDIYKNILGLKASVRAKSTPKKHTQIAMSMSSVEIFSAIEQENFIHDLVLRFPNLPILDLSEIDLLTDVSQTVYIGPATLDALKFCEAGGVGVFLMGQFQGFNLIPYNDGHLFISCRNTQFESKKLAPIIDSILDNKLNLPDSSYSIYQIEHENIFGAYLKSLNSSDDNYPFYQSHVVLWNFLLNLFDTNLEITTCTPSQLTLLKNYQLVLTKYLRLHDYAMVSIDTIYQESKSQEADGSKIDGHIKNLQEIEQITDKISSSHALLRPILDFYRIRRGQNTGDTLLDQSQNSYLTYSEEHQALTALNELFSVTLKKNEVNI